jgi:transcriptional regulator with XRE-family HTH domain
LKTLGETIKEQREAKKLLLRELAALINVDTAMVSKFEKVNVSQPGSKLQAFPKPWRLMKKKLLVIFFSDKIAFDLKGEEVAKETLKIAEKKIAFMQKKIESNESRKTYFVNL